MKYFVRRINYLLYNKYYLSSLIKDADDQKSTFEEEGNDNCNDYDEESSTEESPKNSIPLEQGIIFHKEETTDSRKKAWECFKYHADILKNPLAKYWKANYLYNGYVDVEKNVKEAKKLFKE